MEVWGEWQHNSSNTTVPESQESVGCLMEHHFGHLHRAGSSVKLCPPLKAMVTADIAEDIAAPNKRCIDHNIEQGSIPRRTNKLTSQI